MAETDRRTSANPRRSFLSAGYFLAGAVVTASRAAAEYFHRPAKAGQGQSGSDPVPENTKVRDANPSTFDPPSTDHGEVPTFWNTFSTAHRRLQPGGWSPQVTVADFPLSKDIAGVKMRLTAGGVRELHRHNAGEWALMLNGRARITAIDTEGQAFVDDPAQNDL